MRFFKQQKDPGEGYTVIIGCGRLGANLASAIALKEKVHIIDKDKEAFVRLSPGFSGVITIGDGMDLDVLRDAQIDKAKVLVAVTSNDNANLMIAQMAREIFHVPRVIARLYDRTRECIYQEFGVDTICPAELSARQIESILARKPAAEEDEKDSAQQ